MNKIGEKHYFNFAFSIGISILASLFLLGQIVFFIISFCFFLSDIGLDNILLIGFGIFGIPVLISLFLFFVGAFRYWTVDENEITNAGLLYKCKVRFCEITNIEVKREQIESFLKVNLTDCYFFYTRKKHVIVPINGLTRVEIELLRISISNFDNVKKF